MFRRYKLPTLLNVLGFAVALAAFYLFMSQVIFNYSCNANVPHTERTYRVELQGPLFGNKWTANTAMPMVHALREITHVEDVASTNSFTGNYNIYVDGNAFKIEAIKLSPNSLEFFGAKVLYGSLKQFKVGDCVVTRSEALRLYGKENAVGCIFSSETDGKNGANIVAVVEDMPTNMLINHKVFLPFTFEENNTIQNFNYNTYVRLDNPANAKRVEKDFLEAVCKLLGYTSKTIPAEYKSKFRFTPVKDTWFSGVSEDDKGNKGVMNVLIAACIFIILVAMLNLANFSLAQAPVRIKGVNTRKVLGASNWSLRLSIIKDSVIIALLSIFVAILLVLLFQENAFCMSLIQGSVTFADNLWLAAATTCMAFVVSILAAIYPAFYATSFAPALVLKGSFALSSQGKMLRNAMLLLQFTIAMALVVYVLVLGSQSRFIFNSDYGFDKDQVMLADLSEEAIKNYSAMEQEISKLPFVECVGYGRDVIGDGTALMTWGRGSSEGNMYFNCIPVGYNYLRVFGIDIVEGRNFKESDSKTGAYIVNKHLLKTYPHVKLDRRLFGVGEQRAEGEYDVVGVCNDFKLLSMRTDNSNIDLAFIVYGDDMDDWDDPCQMIFVRTKAGFDKIEARKTIEATMKKFAPNDDINLQFFDKRLENTYQDELRFISQVKVFALICILITLIGVFCLTMFETEFRRKEIGIRKVMGSTEGQILRLFTRRYIVPLVVSFLVGAPVAYAASRIWLESFAEHTPIYWWLFPLALCLVGGIVLLTVVVQTMKVARENPVESVKSE